MPDTEATVFIVDDDQDIRSSLSRALNRRGFETEVYESAKAFLDTYDGSRTGCLILDYGMPDMNGLELQAYLIDNGLSLPIIFVTGHGGVPESVQAMRKGAIDFLEKPFRQDALIERIEAALQIDANQRDVSKRSQRVLVRYGRLTDREREIADFIVANPSNASSKEVARELGISPRTVDHHRARILEKMQARSVAELVDMTVSARLSSR